MFCHCGNPLKPLRKYCSRSCSVSANNRVTKRKPANRCRTCEAPTSRSRVFCDAHTVNQGRRRKRVGGYAAVKRRRYVLKEKAVQYKGGRCMKCGYSKCLRALGFHHRDRASKDFGLGHLSNIGWDRIKAELDKCDLLCANCHMEVHEELDGRVAQMEERGPDKAEASGSIPEPTTKAA